MPEANQPEMEHVADLLRQTFDPPDAAPLDPALIRLMLELAHAPDELRPSAASPPQWRPAPQIERARRRPLFDFARRARAG